jgi:hypothetical protein
MGSDTGDGRFLGVLEAVAVIFLPGVVIAGGPGGSSWVKGVLWWTQEVAIRIHSNT